MANDATQTRSHLEPRSDEPLAWLHSHWLHVVLVDILPYAILYVIAVWLVATTTNEPLASAQRWQLFIPLVGVVATFGGWHRAGDGNSEKAWYLVQQVLHWGTLFIVVKLLFLSSMRHFLDLQSDAFILIYMLGLTCVLSGIYLDWNMLGFGAFLIASAVLYGYIVDNLQLLFSLSGIAVLSIVLVVLIGNKIGKYRRHISSQTDD